MVLQICNFLLNTPLTEMALAPLFFNKFAKKNKYTKKALLWTIVSNTNKLYVQIWLPNSYIYITIYIVTITVTGYVFKCYFQIKQYTTVNIGNIAVRFSVV